LRKPNFDPKRLVAESSDRIAERYLEWRAEQHREGAVSKSSCRKTGTPHVIVRLSGERPFSFTTWFAASIDFFICSGGHI
jgi:hypothetical protein